MLANYTFSSEREGKKLLILGSIHGNEICGNRAVERLRERIMSGELPLISGEITAIPISNEHAFRKDVRYTEENLNRVFYWSADEHFARKYGEKLPSQSDEQFDMRSEMENAETAKQAGLAPANYEQKRAKELARFFADKDAVLDIHSQQVDGEAFCFAQNQAPELVAYVEALQTGNIIYDWDKMFPAGDFATENLAEKMGVLGTTVECGSHKNPESIEIAWRTILNALVYFEIISQESYDAQIAQLAAKYQVKGNPKSVYMKELVRYHKGDKLAKDWQHLEEVRKGQLLATRADGEEIYAKEDAVMVLPNKDAFDNAEWFFLGTLK